MTMREFSSRKLTHCSLLVHSLTVLRIFESGNFSDFIIICGEIQWDVHSTVLCPQSSFFRGALHGDFRVSHAWSTDVETSIPLI
jgi:hypothetical protein